MFDSWNAEKLLFNGIVILFHTEKTPVSISFSPYTNNFRTFLPSQYAIRQPYPSSFKRDIGRLVVMEIFLTPDDLFEAPVLENFEKVPSNKWSRVENFPITIGRSIARWKEEG
jgi:hypothetical protein